MAVRIMRENGPVVIACTRSAIRFRYSSSISGDQPGIPLNSSIGDFAAIA